ncbi:hypothetical protein [Mucilaginibacter paludis]|uniref:DUF3405 domain-containing protein n=1 Tax=Mucilaginibacter paludis DSM 18603 TaxID=714943 RepID=H1Y1N1_9SPHI|nr:hypothetical protein [Mucilaginibacter paludis]EHQ24690.1 hypothetical protein Mucpa_0497 [Mucilaginibacter paludis DSM 18603]
MIAKNCSQVVLLLTKNISQSLLDTYNQLNCAMKESGLVHIMFHAGSTNEIPDDLSEYNSFSFTNEILYELNFKPIQDSLLPGSNHFPLLKFYLENPFFDYYWLIEDDVRFTCNWGSLLKTKTHSDFITCHIRSYQEEPLWYWWNTLSHPNHFIPFDLRLRSFNPIYRISNEALFALSQLLTEKWQGHHEVLIPTLLYLESFNIEDFGGLGTFVKDEFKNRFYIDSSPDLSGIMRDGTIRFRPTIHPSEMALPSKLYHPIKQI